MTDRFVMPQDPVLSARFLRPGRKAPLRQPSPACHWFLLARNAIYHSLSMFGASGGDNVLLPAYVCRAVEVSLEARGVEPRFFRTQRDCSPDLDDVSAKIDSRTRAVLTVHHFGFGQKTHELAALCRSKGVALIEDCAHVLGGGLPNSDLGSLGDAAIFSWRKFLPVADGGELRINRPDLKLSLVRPQQGALPAVKAAKNILEGAILHGPRAIAGPYRWLDSAKNRVLHTPAASDGDTLNTPTETPETRFDRATADHPMSRPSRWVLDHSALPALAARRRDNYQVLHSALRAIDGVTPLFAALPGDVCPWVMPVFFDALPNAHLPLREMGIPAVTWGFVRPRGIPRDCREDAEFLYENLIFLPVHQSLRPEHLDRMIDAVRRVRRRAHSPSSSIPAAHLACAPGA